MTPMERKWWKMKRKRKEVRDVLTPLVRTVLAWAQASYVKVRTMLQQLFFSAIALVRTFAQVRNATPALVLHIDAP